MAFLIIFFSNISPVMRANADVGTEMLATYICIELSIDISSNSQIYKNIVNMAHILVPVNARSTIAARPPVGRCCRYALRG